MVSAVVICYALLTVYAYYHLLRKGVTFMAHHVHRNNENHVLTSWLFAFTNCVIDRSQWANSNKIHCFRSLTIFVLLYWITCKLHFSAFSHQSTRQKTD